MGHVVNKRVLFWIGRMGLTGGERIGCTMRRGNNLEWRAGSFCVLVDGNNEAAAARDRIAKVGVRDGSVRNDPAVLPEPINKI
jgi:hypothetical protein